MVFGVIQTLIKILHLGGYRSFDARRGCGTDRLVFVFIKIETGVTRLSSISLS